MNPMGGAIATSTDRETPEPSSDPASELPLEVLSTLTGKPVERLRAITRVRDTLEQMEAAYAAEALQGRYGFARGSATLEEVGRALGISRSAAHRKHGGHRPARPWS